MELLISDIFSVKSLAFIYSLMKDEFILKDEELDE